MNGPPTMQRAHGAEATVSPTLRQPLRILETASPLPTHADTVVIGGGIIGVFTAYYLARRGVSVAVVEKGLIGAEQSSRIPGFILAAGFSGHGFGIGPGAGHLVADLVTGAAPIFDPAPYRPERFSKSAWGKVADF